MQQFPPERGSGRFRRRAAREPVWRGDGRELFYVAANQTLQAVSIQTTPTFSASRPSKLSDTVIDTGTGGFQTTHYTASADGQRFLANVIAASPVPPAILNDWSIASKSATAR